MLFGAIVRYCPAVAYSVALADFFQATEHHLGLMKAAGALSSPAARACWRRSCICSLQLFMIRLNGYLQGKKGAGEGFEVLKSGDARVALIG